MCVYLIGFHVPIITDCSKNSYAHLGRDTLRYVRLLASYTSRSARHAARRTSDLRRGLQRTTGKRARDRQLEPWERVGIVLSEQKEDLAKSLGYNDRLDRIIFAMTYRVVRLAFRI